MSSVSKNRNKDNHSLYSIGSYKERKYDTLAFRKDFMKELLNGNSLQPVVDVDNLNTEQFVNPNGYHAGNTGSRRNDTAKILNKKMHDFHDVIEQIGGRLLYVKSGSSGHTFKGMIEDDDGERVNYAVKVVAFIKKKYGSINDVRRPENAELMMIRLLSYFVLKKQTPYIALPIGIFNTSIKPFVDPDVVGTNNKKYLEFAEKYKNGCYHDHASVLISEWANRGDLLDFIRSYHEKFKAITWKVFFFQVISVLAVIQGRYPGFRHNDLKANNVLVHKIENRGSMFTHTINGARYILPNIGYQIKLWDFDFACIPGKVENLKVSDDWTNQINISAVQNRYYDMHFFFNTLIKKGFFPQLLESDSIPQETKDFINRIVPPKLQKTETEYISKSGRILINKEVVTPDRVLKVDPYFAEFRKTDKKPDVTISNTRLSELDKMLLNDYKKNLSRSKK